MRDHDTHARPLVLVVTGAPASGKTTIGRALASRLGLPYLSKDLFKEALFDSLGWQDREWSRRVGSASMDLLFRTAAALLDAGRSVALESNFYAAWDTPRVRELGERYGCRFVQVVCYAPGAVLADRFARRARSGERHPGHADLHALEEFVPRLLTERWDALALNGPVFNLDTSRTGVDVDDLVRQICQSGTQ
jgi:predicted kinase